MKSIMKKKKLLHLIWILLLIPLPLFAAGCGNKEPTPAPAEVFVLADGRTAAGIGVGDRKEKFCKAYEDYEILVSLNPSRIPDSVMPIRRIPYGREFSAMIANFFIDGEPRSPQQICAEEDISMDGLSALLSSEAYLRAHEVLYRYLIFYWKDGSIQRIASEELNYNETYEVPYGL